MFNWKKRLLKVFPRLNYDISYAKFLLHRKYYKAKPEYDLVFVLREDWRGWILEAICNEVARYYPGTYHFHFINQETVGWTAKADFSLPSAKAYFFAHYADWPKYLRHNSSLWGRTTLIHYTHPMERKIKQGELIYALNKATKTIFPCSLFLELMVEQGLDRQKAVFIPEGADPDFFDPHERADGAVGFSTAYYPRKSPHLILAIIKNMPHRKFILLGRNWRLFEGFGEMTALPNFTYVEAPYKDYPKYYSLMDVFVSVSKLEGGPVSLIETMMCNIVPVVSRTGIALDIIRHGSNGFLFDVDGTSIEEICGLIDGAYKLRVDIRREIVHLNWHHYSLAVQSFLPEVN